MSCKNKNKMSITRVSALSAFVALGVGMSAIVSSCSQNSAIKPNPDRLPIHIGWKSTIQLQAAEIESVLADQSFSESTYNGMREFYMKECGIDNVPEASSREIWEGNGLWKRPDEGDQGRISSYENIKNDGSKIILATGFTHDTVLHMLTSDSFSADKNRLNDTGFIFIDGAMKKDWQSGGNSYTSNPINVASIAYRTDEGSFLTGIATAVYLNDNWKLFADKKDERPESIGVSAYIGFAIEPTLSFMNGFRQGLMYWNMVAPLITLEDNKPAIPMKWISPTGSYEISNFISGDFSPNNGAAPTITKSMIEKGAKAIMPIAGPQTKLSVNVVEQEGKSVSIIGVDTEQENISDLKKELPGDNTKNIIPFSSLKEIAYSTHQVLNAIKTGEESNGYKGFGWNNIADLDNNGVGVSKAGYSYLIDPLFFTENPKDSESGKIDATTEEEKNPVYNLSSTQTKWKLSDLKRGSTTEDYKKIYANFQKLLSGSIWTKTKESEKIEKWDIQGDELTKTLDSKNLPVITPSKDNKVTYKIEDAFGGAASAQVATGTMLDGTKWTYALEKRFR